VQLHTKEGFNGSIPWMSGYIGCKFVKSNCRLSEMILLLFHMAVLIDSIILLSVGQFPILVTQASLAVYPISTISPPRITT